MLNIFTRRELLLTLDMSKLNKTKEILDSNKINYYTKTTNLQNSTFIGSSRARTGSIGMNLKFAYEFRIFVHKNDYEKANYLIK